MAFPQHITNDNFMYNSMLASALAQLLPPQERHIIRCWIDKLHSIEEDQDIQTRNDYMWFLLILLQNKRIIAPFNSAPSAQPLNRLTDAVSPLLYDEILKNTCGSANLQWIDQVLSRNTSPIGDSDFVARTSTNAKPSEFLHNQPIPKSGIICYMGAFSDQSP